MAKKPTTIVARVSDKVVEGFVEGSKYGVVGSSETQQVKIKINNPDPISARNACKLRITVHTSDGNRA